MLTKIDLIKMDERFIEWLASPDGKADFNNIKSGCTYLIVNTSRDSELFLAWCKDKEDLVRQAKELYEESENNWEIEAVYNLATMKEVSLQVTVTIVVEEE